MKKIIVVLCLLCFAMPCFATECNRYKGLCFSKIYYDMYKRPIIYNSNHNQIVNYHAGAAKLCKDLGMRLPSKDEAQILSEYLKNSGIADKRNMNLWLKETATGKFGNIYINENSTNSAYILTYNSVVRPIQSFLSPMNKSTGMSSAVCTICVKEADPITNEDRINLIKEDYKGYLNGKNAFYGYVDNALKDLKWGQNSKINKSYLETIKTRLDNILNSPEAQNYLSVIEINDSDSNKLSENTKLLIRIFNNIIEGDDF